MVLTPVIFVATEMVPQLNSLGPRGLLVRVDIGFISLIISLTYLLSEIFLNHRLSAFFCMFTRGFTGQNAGTLFFDGNIHGFGLRFSIEESIDCEFYSHIDIAGSILIKSRETCP